jgi:hypothetical protein
MQARNPHQLLDGLRHTALGTLRAAAGELVTGVEHALGHRLEHDALNAPRGTAEALRELKVNHSRWHKALQDCAARELSTPPNGQAAAAARAETELAILGANEVERQLQLMRTAHAIAQQLEWELADLNARVSFLQGVQGVDEARNPVRPEVLARIAQNALAASGLSQAAAQVCAPLFIHEFADLAVHLYHELNAWLIREGVLPKIDLRAMVVRSVSSERWSQLTVQSLVEWQQPPIEPAKSAASSSQSRNHDARELPTAAGSGYGATSLISLGHNSVRGNPAPVPQQHDAGLWVRMRNFFSSMPAGVLSPARRGGEVDLLQLLDQVHTHFLSTMPAAEWSERAASRSSAAAALPRLVQFRDELKAAATSAHERATVEIIALMFEYILADETIPSSARVLFARLQIPVLRVAIRENESFMEATHPARDFIDRLGAVVQGYAGETKVDERLLAEMRRLVMAAERAQGLNGQFFARLLYDFEHFLEIYGRELREVSVSGVPMLEQTEDYKVNAVLYTIEMRKLLDEVPCEPRLRDFLVHSWVGVLCAVAGKHGVDSAEAKQNLRLAADLVWHGVPKSSDEERARAVSDLPELMRRVEYALADAGTAPDAQRKVSTRLRSLLLQVMRTPGAQAPSVVFDALIAKLQELESAVEQARERSVNYRIPLASLRSQIAARSLALQVLEPSDFGLDDRASAPGHLKVWAMHLPVGTWFKLDAAERLQALQLVWVSPRKNYLLLSDTSGTSGIVTEPNTLALLAERGGFKPLETEPLTNRAARNALRQLQPTAAPSE